MPLHLLASPLAASNDKKTARPIFALRLSELRGEIQALRRGNSRRSVIDWKDLDRQTRKRVQNAFQALETDAANLDIKPVAGHALWRRLHVSEHRVLYHELADDPAAPYLVAGVIGRRALHRAIDRL